MVIARFFENRHREKLRERGREHLRAMAQHLGIEQGLFIRAMEEMTVVSEFGALAQQGEAPAYTARLYRENIHRAFEYLAKREGDTLEIVAARHKLGPPTYIMEGTEDLLHRYALKIERDGQPDQEVADGGRRGLEQIRFPGGYPSARCLIVLACENEGQGYRMVFSMKGIADRLDISQQDASNLCRPLAEGGYLRMFEMDGNTMAQLTNEGVNMAGDIIVSEIKFAKSLGRG